MRSGRRPGCKLQMVEAKIWSQGLGGACVRSVADRCWWDGRRCPVSLSQLREIAGADCSEGLVLLIVSCGFACRHSQRVQACGLAVWRCCRYLANKARASVASACTHCIVAAHRHARVCEVGCWRRCKSCCGACCSRCRRPPLEGVRESWMAPTEPCCVRLFRTSPTAEAGRVAVGSGRSGCPRWNEGKSKRETRGKARAGQDLRSDIQTCAEVIRCLTFVSGATAESCFHERSVLGDVEICEIDSLDKLCA